MQPIQTILIFFLIFAISRVYLRAREGTLTFGEMLFWGSIFTIAIYGVIDTNFLQFVAKQVGIGRGADVAIYSSIILIFYLLFRTTVMIEDLNHQITRLVREIALIKEDKPKKKSHKKKNTKA